MSNRLIIARLALVLLFAVAPPLLAEVHTSVYVDHHPAALLAFGAWGALAAIMCGVLANATYRKANR